MNKLQLLTAAVILLLLLNIGTLVFLFCPNDRRPAPPGPEGNAGDFIIKSLQLDEQQCRQFDTLRIQHHFPWYNAPRMKTAGFMTPISVC